MSLMCVSGILTHSPLPPLLFFPPFSISIYISPSFPSYLPSFLPCNSLLSPPLHTSLPSSILCHHFLPPFLPSLSLPSSLPPLPSRVWSRCMGAVDTNQYKSLGGQYQIQGCPTIKVSSNLLAVCIQCNLHITYEYMHTEADKFRPQLIYNKSYGIHSYTQRQTKIVANTDNYKRLGLSGVQTCVCS